MTNKVILQVTNLGKRYKIYKNPWDRMKEWFSFRNKSYHQEFWAVTKISLEVEQGEFLGIIGVNGAGKSTFLKMITGVIQPTTGNYRVNGRVLSLLELGSDLDLNLTGRENIIRSAQLMELPEGYIEQRMSEIEEFSELGEFFDRPMSMYSTGMRTRLSFSMFAFIDCDMIILDEVLAVGDIFFRQKCYARLEELIKKNTAIILVTHELGIVHTKCKRVLLIHEGEVLFNGNPGIAIRRYTQMQGQIQARLKKKQLTVEDQSMPKLDIEKPFISNEGKQLFWPSNDLFDSFHFPPPQREEGVKLVRLAFLNENGEPAISLKQGNDIYLYFEFLTQRPIGIPVLSIDIRDHVDFLVHSKNSLQGNVDYSSPLQAGQIIRFRQKIKLSLAPYYYIFHVELYTLTPEDFKRLNKFSNDELLVRRLHRVVRLERAFGINLLTNRSDKTEHPHGGMCDLPGETDIQVLQ